MPSLGDNSTDGYWVVDTCVLGIGPGGLTWVPRTPGSTPPAAAVVVQTALSKATWPTIKVALSPPPERMLVNFPVWLHLASGWKNITATAAITGLSATVTAKPESVRWDMGDGQTVTCHTAGAAYDASLPWATNLDRRDCGYTYARSSANHASDHFQLTITIHYGISWTSSTGGSGSLGGYDRSTTAAVAVGQLESLEN